MIAWFAGQPLPTQVGLAILAAPLLAILTFFAARKFIKLGHQEDLEARDRVGLQIECIKTAAQILGGLFFLVTIYVAWQNLVVSQEKYKTDLFVKAIEQLGSDKLEVRLGGIYALERIARDSEKDHGPIMEVLTAFVRLHAPWPPEKPSEAKDQPAEAKKPTSGEKKPETKPAPEVKPRADIQAILMVLGRRTRTYGKGEAQRLDLRQTDLRRADLFKAHLEGANLWRAHLERTKLEKAHLEGADIREAHLEGAVLREAQLGEAVLRRAHLDGAVLWKAHLEGADLEGAHLEWAVLVGAHLKGADFYEAHLKGAFLNGAHLEGADLYGAQLERADFRGADFSGAKCLTKEQIDSAIIDEKTKLPDYLKKTGPNKAEPK